MTSEWPGGNVDPGCCVQSCRMGALRLRASAQRSSGQGRPLSNRDIFSHRVHSLLLWMIARCRNGFDSFLHLPEVKKNTCGLDTKGFPIEVGASRVWQLFGSSPLFARIDPAGIRLPRVPLKTPRYSLCLKGVQGVPITAQLLTHPASIHED